MPHFIWTFLFVVLATGAAHGEELILEQAIGLEESGPINFINPYDIAWDLDGRAFVLSGGDARVVVFSSQWEHLHSFAGKGGAPGELHNPSMLLVIGDELWVKVPRGAEVFDLKGNYIRLVRMPNAVSSIQSVGGNLFGRSTSSAGVGVLLDAQGIVRSSFGPKPPEHQSMFDLMQTMSWLLLAEGDDHCALLNMFDGRVLQFREDFRSQPEVDLGLGRGKTTGAMSFKKVVSDACRDPYGGYFVTHYDKPDGQGYLYHYDETWDEDGRWEIPTDVNAGTVRVTPNAKICLISESSSVLYIFDRPLGLGDMH